MRIKQTTAHQIDQDDRQGQQGARQRRVNTVPEILMPDREDQRRATGQESDPHAHGQQPGDCEDNGDPEVVRARRFHGHTASIACEPVLSSRGKAFPDATCITNIFSPHAR